MTTATVLKEGLGFGEDPRWHDGLLWFSDFYCRAGSRSPRCRSPSMITVSGRKVPFEGRFLPRTVIK